MHVPWPCLKLLERSYVMKELMSVGWESQEKDKNMVEVVT